MTLQEVNVVVGGAPQNTTSPHQLNRLPTLLFNTSQAIMPTHTTKSGPVPSLWICGKISFVLFRKTIAIVTRITKLVLESVKIHCSYTVQLPSKRLGRSSSVDSRRKMLRGRNVKNEENAQLLRSSTCQVLVLCECCKLKVGKHPCPWSLAIRRKGQVCLYYTKI